MSITAIYLDVEGLTSWILQAQVKSKFSAPGNNKSAKTETKVSPLLNILSFREWKDEVST